MALGAPRSSTLAFDESLNMDLLTKVIALLAASIAMVAQIIGLPRRVKDRSAESTAPTQRASSAFERADLPQKIGFLIQAFSGVVLFPVSIGLLMYWAARGSTEPLTFRSASFLAAMIVSAVVSSRMPKL